MEEAKKDTLVIIPTYNERENIEAIAAATLEASPNVDILFVDDNSPDGTGQIAERLAKENERIQVLHRKEKNGLGQAYISGFKWALERPYQFIMEMDCDFSHNPKEIPLFRETAFRGADLVLGSRYKGGIRVINWPLSRLMLSCAAAVYVKMITGMPFTDPTSGFKCFRRKVLETIPFERIAANGYGFQIEMTHKAWMRGFRIEEIPIIFEDRQEGISKMSANIISEALLLVWALAVRNGFRRHPPRKKKNRKSTDS